MAMAQTEVRFAPGNKKVQVRPGATLLEAGRRAQAGIRSRCDAKAACLMCKLLVEDQSGLTPPNQNEILKLGMEQLAQGYRLACQARVTGRVEALVPEDPLKAAIRAQLARQQDDDDLF
ncbi:2Fe-2S iron-sulfur cluster binding domain-containing protein [Paenibacillus athensensis]|uniref:Ferredoxin n=1 Tax=Paenibacillus athensensis TaxID=1967502 RepID=A0A4Y8Q7V0_9BACL|nr:2Fe-2S iron-sulfur cluster-binding protein [Paenibacillus athensensis]MCD1260209.1 2Fe-2S iron-sulfur cluster binding domain-containing protein [Paenibacillus athensensis]